MLKNHTVIALRNLHKQKYYSFINIFGLAIGLTCFIIIGLFVQFELRRFQKNKHSASSRRGFHVDKPLG